MQNKKTLREKNRIIRATLEKGGALLNISKEIIEKIKKEEFFINAKNIMIFYPKSNEINLLPLLDFKDKNFYLPRCKGENMEICHYKKGQALVCNKFNINEPVGTAHNDLSILDVIFMPALGADLFGARIGHGFGFYDRFLSRKEICAKKVVVLPKALVCDRICTESFDIEYDNLITE